MQCCAVILCVGLQFAFVGGWVLGIGVLICVLSLCVFFLYFFVIEFVLVVYD